MISPIDGALAAPAPLAYVRSYFWASNIMASRNENISGVFAGRYAIEREAGRGGTAVVYRATDLKGGNIVAVKVLHDVLLESRTASRFLREVDYTRRLKHDGILPVLDSGTADGHLFFVLPFMEGGTLRDRLRQQKQLAYGEAVKIAASIAEALAHAHKAGLLHRDVKPENILFADGKAYLGDFGIARALERATDEVTTSTGMVRGTAAYMSPEQAAGQQTYDGRSDIYSLGCVLYEMIAGIPAFVGPTAQAVITQRLSFKPASLLRYRERVPASLDRVVATSMALAPADRYAEASEMVDALETVASELRDSSYVTMVDSARRRRWQVALAASLVLVLAFAVKVWIQEPDDPTLIPAGDPRRIAVLYLDDLTPDVLPPYVADGITEDLIDRLGAVSGLQVTSPSGVRPFRGTSVSTDSVRATLRVGTVVSGSLARSDSMLRINVRLVDASSGRIIASQLLEEKWSELFSLQDRLTGQVELWLRQRLGDEIAIRAHRRETRSLAAWEAVQEASAYTRRAIETSLLRNSDAADETRFFLRADSTYVRASDLDPQWVHPVVQRGELALLALAPRSLVPPDHADSARYAAMTPNERKLIWIQRAHQLAETALRMKPDDAHALALRGNATYQMLNAGPSNPDSLRSAAERDLRAALAIRPALAGPWVVLAELAMQRGQFSEAAEAGRRAIEADAFLESRRALAVAFSASLHAELFDEARRWCEIGLLRYRADPRFTECELRLIGWVGRTESEAATAWGLVSSIEAADTQKMLAATWSFRRLMVAAILARAGRADSARSVLASVRRQQSETARRSGVFAESYVLLLLDDKTAALARLQEHLREFPELRAQITEHPWFGLLHGDPRFAALTRPAN